jgi:hypothetical protein
MLVEPTREPPGLPPLPSHSLLLPLRPSFKAPIRPPLKPAHLRATPIVPSQLTSVTSTTQRTSPPPLPLWAPGPQQLQQRSKAPATPPEYGPTHMSSVAEQQDDILLSQLHYPLENISSTSLCGQPQVSPSSAFSWETGIQHSVEGVPRDGGYVLNTAHVNTRCLFSEVD